MTIRVDKHEGYAVITLDNAAQRNALTPDMVDVIMSTLDELEADETMGAVVVTGNGPGFCAGANLSNLEHGSQTREEREAGLRKIYESFLRFGRSPLLTIAAVNGSAVGAGMNLALCCDVRIAAKSAKFICRFVDLGLHPGGGHTWMLRQTVGYETAAVMLLANEPLDGEQAARRGLAYQCVEDDQLLATATAMAKRAAGMPIPLVRLVKDTLNEVGKNTNRVDAMEVEIVRQLWTQEQPFFSERLAALQKKITSK